MTIIYRESQFKRDVKKAQKRGKDMKKIKAVIRLLISGEQLPSHLKDHPLKGGRGSRDLHIEPDWVLIYRFDKAGNLHLIRTGSHSDLF